MSLVMALPAALEVDSVLHHPKNISPREEVEQLKALSKGEKGNTYRPHLINRQARSLPLTLILLADTKE